MNLQIRFYKNQNEIEINPITSTWSFWFLRMPGSTPMGPRTEAILSFSPSHVLRRLWAVSKSLRLLIALSKSCVLSLAFSCNLSHLSSVSPTHVERKEASGGVKGGSSPDRPAGSGGSGGGCFGAVCTFGGDEDVGNSGEYPRKA